MFVRFAVKSKQHCCELGRPRTRLIIRDFNQYYDVLCLAQLSLRDDKADDGALKWHEERRRA